MELEGLNLVELLDLLEPVPEPEPVSMAPQTAGWVWLGVVLLLLLAVAVRAFVRHRRANAYRRAALAELDAAGDDPARIAEIVRRTALRAFPRREVASVHGEDWLAFLDRTGRGAGFVSAPGRAMLAAPYRPVPPDPALASLARDWVRHHRPARAAGRS